MYALLYFWSESFHFVFLGIYHRREQLLCLSFLGLFFGAFIVTPFFVNPYYVQEPENTNDKGQPEPKERMPVAIVGASPVPVSLTFSVLVRMDILGDRGNCQLIVPIIGSSHFGVAALVFFVSPLSPLTLFSHTETRQFHPNYRTSC